jgi:hypothetical protein
MKRNAVEMTFAAVRVHRPSIRVTSMNQNSLFWSQRLTRSMRNIERDEKSTSTSDLTALTSSFEVLNSSEQLKPHGIDECAFR